ncbi:MFS general substrate transporter [Laetiporus sulphureus 93-53]|uniref:MFS general substrate transporter n=1 Tax=Laetiporus sulphureus 93-53 TaxID=1314785 RepID=A0A165G0B9_9APHY|nr:MFS general substrate transporter [Laetiporus sulphureus 93-53]KZT09657.1 MFS general substrate transporter [Laetiporus sulphureus 93-53]
MSSSRESSRYHRDASRERHLASTSRGTRSVSASRTFPLELDVEADLLIHPDGAVATEILRPSETEIEEATDSLETPVHGVSSNGQDFKPWWKRPSPWWFLTITPVVALARAATMAPRVEIYIQLVCDAYRPDTTVGQMFSLAAKDGDRWELCSSDPVVQAAVAKLAMAMTTSMGVLGCLTTGWWGSLSDRYGRTRVMTVAIIGLLLEDLGFLIVCNFSKLLPGGYWALTVAPVIAGLMGGLGTAGANMNAYIADCTDVTSRSRFFSLSLGLLFLGYSIGPTFGSVLISYTRNTLSVFAVAATLHVAYAFLTGCIIPESLSTAHMAEARGRAAEEEAQRTKGGVRIWLARTVGGFIRPLALLLPGKVEMEDGKQRRKRDWSLLLLAAGYGCTIALKGDITYEYQYMSLMYGWTSEELGYYTSALGTTRTVYLTILLPLIMKTLQPKPAIQISTEQHKPLDYRSISRPTSPSTKSQSPPPGSPSHHASPALDLALARLSILIELVAYTLMALAPNGHLFTAYAIVSALGAGFTPAVNSVASALYMQQGGRELGKLFGALGVVQTICSQVMGPFVFGVTYMKTVATFPQAIFVVTVAVLAVSFIMLVPTRVHSPSNVDVEGPTREPTPVGERAPLLMQRGRKAAGLSATA